MTTECPPLNITDTQFNPLNFINTCRGRGPTGPAGAGSTGPTGPYNIEELTLIVKNDSGVQIDKGMAVMAVSAVGDRIRVARAVNDGTISAEYYLGIALANIPDGSEGEVMVFGNIGQLDTSSYVIGDLLYLSPTTPGQLTKTKPTSPSIDLSVAIVTRVQLNSGRLFARFWSMGQKVSQLYDTIISGPTGGNMLVYENGIWGNTGDVRATSIINADGYTGGNMFLVGDLSLTGRLANTSDALEIGFQSGQTSQGASAIAIGNSAGQTSQGISAVSIGLQAGQTSQNTGCVAIGTTAGRTAQGTGAIAIGNSAGQTTQGADGVAIGRLSGISSQGTSCVAVGLQAGRANQGVNAIAIGSSAGFTGQGSGAVAIGVSSGITAQGSNAIGIGNSAGRVSQNNNCVAIGTSGGQLNQGINAIAIGAFAGLNTQGANSVAMGFQCGLTGQSINSVAIGTLAGQTLQSSSSVAIGINAGNSSQSSSSVAVGIQAGQTSQNTASVAIGDRAGNNTQGSRCIAIGLQAGATTQSANSVAVGANAGQVTQGANSVAVGVLSGQLSQNASAVAIGYNAGNNAQGTNAVAIGTSAGLTGQHANTIIVNAQGTALNSDGIDRTFIAPIRNTGTNNVLYYNTSSKEVTYNTTPSGPTGPTGPAAISNMTLLSVELTYTDADSGWKQAVAAPGANKLIIPMFVSAYNATGDGRTTDFNIYDSTYTYTWGQIPALYNSSPPTTAWGSLVVNIPSPVSNTRWAFGTYSNEQSDFVNQALGFEPSGGSLVAPSSITFRLVYYIQDV